MADSYQSKLNDPRYRGLAAALGIKSLDSENDVRQVDELINNQDYQDTARQLGIRSFDSENDLRQIRQAIASRDSAPPPPPQEQAPPPTPEPPKQEPRPVTPDPTRSETNPYRVGSNPGAYGTEENRRAESEYYNQMMRGVSDYMRNSSRSSAQFSRSPSSDDDSFRVTTMDGGPDRDFFRPPSGRMDASELASRRHDPSASPERRRADDLLAQYREQISRMTSPPRGDNR